MRDITQLHPKLQVTISKLKQQCLEKGLKISITECVRTVAEQDKLYAQGRTTPGKIVTKGKGSEYGSMHQWGIAFDFCRNDGKGAFDNSDKFFNKVGAIGKQLGLMWGGSWKSIVDLPHFQLPYWGSGPTALKTLYKTPANFKESWGEAQGIRKDEDDMTLEDKKKMADFENKVDTLEQKVNNLTKGLKVYHYMSDLPDWAKPVVQEGINKGIIAGVAKDDKGITDLGLTMFEIKALAYDMRDK